jgi:serine/threonine protein kinase
MSQGKEEFPITALREIQILQELRHDNIVRLIEVCRLASTFPHVEIGIKSTDK